MQTGCESALPFSIAPCREQDQRDRDDCREGGYPSGHRRGDTRHDGQLSLRPARLGLTDSAVFKAPRRTGFKRSSSGPARMPTRGGMGSVVSVLFGAGVGVAIVLGCWQLALLADEVWHHGRDEVEVAA